MKKILLFCLISIMISGFCFGEDSDSKLKSYTAKNDEFFNDFVEQTFNWFKKLETCTPAKVEYKGIKFAIYGKTKNGKCHYADGIYYLGETTPIQCVVPMPVAVALSTTALDSVDLDFEERSPNIREQRKKQFKEIYAASWDYCDVTPFYKKYGIEQ